MMAQAIAAHLLLANWDIRKGTPAGPPRSPELGPFLWFGAEPGQTIASLGDRLARHTSADHTGVKGLRPNLRVLRKSSFQELSTIDEVAHVLFGVQPV